MTTVTSCNESINMELYRTDYSDDYSKGNQNEDKNLYLQKNELNSIIESNEYLSDSYQDIINTYTELDEAFYFKNKGNYEFTQRNYKKAIEYYTRSINLKRDKGCLLNRSFCYYKLKDYRGTILDAQSVLRTDHKNIEAYKAKSMAQIKLGD